MAGSRVLSGLLASFFVACLATVAAAQTGSYPSRPISLVVAYPPGGLSDIPARALAPELQSRFGVPVIVDNRPGASGTIGATHVARSAPDGYTFLVISSANVTNPPTIKLPFDVMTDFLPVGMILEGPPLTFVVQPSLPIKTIEELIAHAKANPGKLSFGNSGVGTVTALTTAEFAKEAGIDITQVSYRSVNHAGTAVVAGEIEGAFTFQSAAKQLVADGRLRALALASEKRDPAWPDVPTMIESGFPTIVQQGFVGLVAPAKTPPEIVALVNKHLNEIVRSSTYRSRFSALGMYPVEANGPADFGAYLKQQVDRHGERLKLVTN